MVTYLDTADAGKMAENMPKRGYTQKRHIQIREGLRENICEEVRF